MKEKEEERLRNLKEIEKVFFDKGVEYIAGIDEAGHWQVPLLLHL